MVENVLLQGGVVGVVIAAWIWINKANMEAFKDVLSNQENRTKTQSESQATREKGDRELLLHLIDTQNQQSQRQYEALKEMIETNQHLIGQIADLKHLVVSNQQCPIQRKEFGK